MRTVLLSSLLLAAGAVPVAVAGPGVEPCVPLARSWDDAVEKARALNVPLVVHRHGFY